MTVHLEQQLQRLGELRQQRQAIEADERRLSRAVRSVMSEHGMAVLKSDGFEAKLIRQERLTVRPAAFQKAVTKKEFLEAATISVTAAREILGDRKLRKISNVTESVQLRITARATRTSATSRDTVAEASA